MEKNRRNKIVQRITVAYSAANTLISFWIIDKGNAFIVLASPWKKCLFINKTMTRNENVMRQIDKIADICSMQHAEGGNSSKSSLHSSSCRISFSCTCSAIADSRSVDGFWLPSLTVHILLLFNRNDYLYSSTRVGFIFWSVIMTWICC